ncbi:MAG: Lnb N-terminal periplasmic domain-containing protein [Paracoccaceae bacterium]
MIPKLLTFGRMVALTALILSFVCAGFAFRYQLSGAEFNLTILIWLTVGIVLLGLMFQNASKRRGSVFLMSVMMLGFFFWWVQIVPRNDREWAPELAHTVTGIVENDQVVLTGIRNFKWQTTDDFVVRWETRSFDLSALETVDAVLSYWGKEAIAHVLVSFGFSDGNRVVFSAEIRRELGEEFSELGGLFKQFELILVAATEEDILQLRTNARDPREDVYVYPIKISEAARRNLFLSYVSLANELAERPQWYNTITENCTTAIYRLVRQLNPDTAFDWRFLASGYLPEYFAENEMFVWLKPFGDFRKRAAISDKAQGVLRGENYSDVIRR